MESKEKNGLLPIGKMAELNHVSVPTLRLYDELGLLHPRYTDPDSGYRYYDLQQTARLDMIAYMKELGMRLNEISDILQKEDITLIEQKLAEKNELIHRQMRELKSQHDAVQRAIASIERYRKSPLTGTISLEYIDQRYIWTIPCDDFYQGDITAYEETLQSLRGALIRQNVQRIHSYNIGTSIRQQDFEQKRFRAAEVFIFGDKHLKEYEGHVEMLDSGMYACIYLDSYDEELRYAEQLLQFCREHRYRIAGDYICEVLTEFNVFDSEKRSMFLRLQVPVSFDK